MIDPYLRSGPNDPLAPASSLIAIIPSDTVPLTHGIKSLRIFNGTGAVATIKVVMISGAPVTFTVPVGLTIEPIRITQVMATGTTLTAGLELFGYTDVPYTLGDQ